MRLALALVVLSGCLGNVQDGHDFVAVADLDAYKLGTLYVEGKRDTTCLVRNVALAREVLAMSWQGLTSQGDLFSAGPFVSREFDMRGVAIYVYADDTVGEDSNASLGKYDYRDGSLHLSENMGSLVHELLHHYEIAVLGTSEQDAIAHKFWSERGFYYAANYYRSKVIPALGGEGCR